MTTATSALGNSLAGTPTSAVKASNDQVNKNEFLQLLVTQLKHQDPLDPMKNEDFAVQLAQFSSLEQLTSINQKIGEQNNSEASSMVSYLGREVTLSSSVVNVKNGDAGSVRFDLGSDSANVKIELIDANNEVAASLDTGALSAGRQSIDLNGLTAANGAYNLRVTSTRVSGGEENPIGYAAGLVSGYMPGANPALIVGGREVTLNDILEVNLAGSV